MKERLKEIRQWWDEVIKDVEEEEAAEENDKEECAVAEDDMALPSQVDNMCSLALIMDYY
jgi:hypothetical protein